MQYRLAFLALVGAALATGLVAGDVVAQAQTHIGHIMEGFPRAPEGAGLLSVATAEAEVAAQHAQLAGSDRTNVDPMVRHARHVLHAVDPARFPNGPGAGFGVKAAADAIAQHIEMAAGAEGASAGVQQHAPHVATAARAVSARADEIAALVDQIVATSDYTQAYELVRQLQQLTTQLVAGADASGDGRIALDEGGLEHVATHMGLMTSSASR
jgi:hypothetical protein